MKHLLMMFKHFATRRKKIQWRWTKQQFREFSPITRFKATYSDQSQFPLNESITQCFDCQANVFLSFISVNRQENELSCWRQTWCIQFKWILQNLVIHCSIQARVQDMCFHVWKALESVLEDFSCNVISPKSNEIIRTLTTKDEVK